MVGITFQLADDLRASGKLPSRRKSSDNYPMLNSQHQILSAQRDVLSKAWDAACDCDIGYFDVHRNLVCISRGKFMELNHKLGTARHG